MGKYGESGERDASAWVRGALVKISNLKNTRSYDFTERTEIYELPLMPSTSPQIILRQLNTKSRRILIQIVKTKITGPLTKT
jgi:hypothetical protein